MKLALLIIVILFIIACECQDNKILPNALVAASFATDETLYCLVNNTAVPTITDLIVIGSEKSIINNENLASSIHDCDFSNHASFTNIFSTNSRYDYYCRVFKLKKPNINYQKIFADENLLILMPNTTQMHIVSNTQFVVRNFEFAVQGVCIFNSTIYIYSGSTLFRAFASKGSFNFEIFYTFSDPILQLSCYNGNTVAAVLLDTFNVYMFGNSSTGCFANETVTVSDLPVRIFNVPRISYVSVGASHVSAIEFQTRRLIAWGMIGSTTKIVTPIFMNIENVDVVYSGDQTVLTTVALKSTSSFTVAQLLRFQNQKISQLTFPTEKVSIFQRRYSALIYNIYIYSFDKFPFQTITVVILIFAIVTFCCAIFSSIVGFICSLRYFKTTNRLSVLIVLVICLVLGLDYTYGTIIAFLMFSGNQFILDNYIIFVSFHLTTLCIGYLLVPVFTAIQCLCYKEVVSKRAVLQISKTCFHHMIVLLMLLAFVIINAIYIQYMQILNFTYLIFMTFLSVLISTTAFCLVCAVSNTQSKIQIHLVQPFSNLQKDRQLINMLLNNAEYQQLKEEVQSSAIDKDLFTISLSQISNLEEVATGAMGLILKGKWSVSNEIVALKLFRGKVCKDDLIHELRLLCSLRHPNIVALYGAIMEEPRYGYVMEYCARGSLMYLIEKNQVARNLRIPILLGIAKGMYFLHSKKYVNLKK